MQDKAYITPEGKDTAHAREVEERYRRELEDLRASLSSSLPERDKMTLAEYRVTNSSRDGKGLLQILKDEVPAAQLGRVSHIKAAYAFMNRQARMQGESINFIAPGDTIAVHDGEVQITRKNGHKFSVWLFPWEDIADKHGEDSHDKDEDHRDEGDHEKDDREHHEGKDHHDKEDHDDDEDHDDEDHDEDDHDKDDGHHGDDDHDEDDHDKEDGHHGDGDHDDDDHHDEDDHDTHGDHKHKSVEVDSSAPLNEQWRTWEREIIHLCSEKGVYVEVKGTDNFKRVILRKNGRRGVITITRFKASHNKGDWTKEHCGIKYKGKGHGHDLNNPLEAVEEALEEPFYERKRGVIWPWEKDKSDH